VVTINQKNRKKSKPHCAILNLRTAISSPKKGQLNAKRWALGEASSGCFMLKSFWSGGRSIPRNRFKTKSPFISRGEKTACPKKGKKGRGIIKMEMAGHPGVLEEPPKTFQICGIEWGRSMVGSPNK